MRQIKRDRCRPILEPSGWLAMRVRDKPPSSGRHTAEPAECNANQRMRNGELHPVPGKNKACGACSLGLIQNRQPPRHCGFVEPIRAYRPDMHDWKNSDDTFPRGSLQCFRVAASFFARGISRLSAPIEAETRLRGSFDLVRVSIRAASCCCRNGLSRRRRPNSSSDESA